MIIKGRKAKKYSDKLFNELCLLFLLISSENEAFLYVVNELVCSSNRTIYRYIKDLNMSGLTPIIGIDGDKDYKYYSMNIHKKLDYYYLITYLLNYQKQSVKSKDVHLSRLYRIGKILLLNMCKYEINNNEVIIDAIAIPNIYKKISKRTLQRDIVLLKDVIIKMDRY